jgi:hypothetical protein
MRPEANPTLRQVRAGWGAAGHQDRRGGCWAGLAGIRDAELSVTCERAVPKACHYPSSSVCERSLHMILMGSC